MFILLKKNLQGQQAGTKIDVANADDAKTLIESGIGEEVKGDPLAELAENALAGAMGPLETAIESAMTRRLKEFADAQNKSRKTGSRIIFGEDGHDTKGHTFGDWLLAVASKWVRDIDRARDIVISRGIKDDFYRLNPVVTLNHNYSSSPVGKSLWRKWVREGDRKGIKAKTLYPEKPADWDSKVQWMPDICLGMVKAGLLNGKSIGFVPTRTRLPTDQELRKSPELQTVRRIIEECYLVEYCCCPFPVQQYATVESVSKSMDVSKELWELLGIDPDALKAAEEQAEQQPPLVVFTPLSEVQKHLALAIHNIDVAGLAEKICDSACHTLRGGI